MSAGLMPVLSVDGLHVGFRGRGGWTEIVRGPSFSIAAGETVAMVGESGSGKSVSALSILRLLPERQARIGGSVRIEGRELLTLSRAAMMNVRGRDVGMIFQEPMTSLNPVYTVSFQIAETLRRHRGLSAAQARSEVLDLLERVRIPDASHRAGQYPHELSGGMRQRVMIAMALACRPKLLIADEPTTALDVTVQAQILDLLRTLQAELGTAIMFITHDMGVVAEIADRVLVMRSGKLVESGTAADVFRAPRHEYTRVLLGAIPRLGAQQDEPRPPPAQETLLAVEDLVCRFPVRGGLLGRPVGEVHAVDGVSFSIRPGETLALVGESGCGKSTTGRAVMRLIRPTAGTVRFEGRDVGGLEPSALRALRRRMQIIFQDPFGSLNPRRTIGTAISEPMRVHGIAAGPELRDRTAELLRRVGLDPAFASRFPHQFSGGQRQRICIARALALEPRLLIADEAVSALDVSIKGQIIELLIELQETLGLAYLFISHDIAAVERISHRVAVMRFGEIVELGPRAAVLGAPQHSYTRALLAAVPVSDPSRRTARPRADAEELRSPVRPLGLKCNPKRLRAIGPNHFVQPEPSSIGTA